MLFSRNSTMEVMRKPTSLSPTYPDSMREFFSNAWNMSHPQSWYVLFPVKRHRYISDSTVSGLKMFHDVPTLMSYWSVGKYHSELMVWYKIFITERGKIKGCHTTCPIWKK